MLLKVEFVGEGLEVGEDRADARRVQVLAVEDGEDEGVEGADVELALK